MLAKMVGIYEMKYLSGIVFRDNFAPKYMCATPFNITREKKHFSDRRISPSII